MVTKKEFTFIKTHWGDINAEYYRLLKDQRRTERKKKLRIKEKNMENFSLMFLIQFNNYRYQGGYKDEYALWLQRASNVVTQLRPNMTVV